LIRESGRGYRVVPDRARRRRRLQLEVEECIYTYMIADVQCLCATARAASRELTRRYDAALRPAGLRTTQLSLLSRLEDEGPMTVSRLAARLGLDRTSLTRELAVLAGRDLVTITAGADRRARVVELAPAGSDALAVAWPHWEAAQAAAFAGLGRERTARLIDDLRAAAALGTAGAA
jgi:DNA-binding MarR family transcriptional regulator